MPNIIANGIQIEYDTFGESSSPPSLMRLQISRVKQALRSVQTVLPKKPWNWLIMD